MARKKLYRSKKQRVVGGVCGGIAEYLKADPTIIRLAWIFGSFVWPPGFVLYFLAWLIMPQNERHKP
ncbi:MAG: PspC domain-containing protein [Candidatus Altiarchaeota archaeon]|nr:PspC domain-containing protein [Candidatus Altiarchaeota archaeon]